MSNPNAQTNDCSTLILKTKFFNDEEFICNSLQVELADDATIIDISDKTNADFTDAEWDRILNSILSSTKVITA